MSKQKKLRLLVYIPALLITVITLYPMLWTLSASFSTKTQIGRASLIPVGFTLKHYSMPASKAQQRAVAKYMAANYDEIKIRVPKGRKADIDAYAKTLNESINGLMNGLLRDALGMNEVEWKQTSDEVGEA